MYDTFINNMHPVNCLQMTVTLRLCQSVATPRMWRIILIGQEVMEAQSVLEQALQLIILTEQKQVYFAFSYCC